MADTIWTAPTKRLSASRTSPTTFPGTSARCYHRFHGQNFNGLSMQVSRNTLVSASSPATGMWLMLTRPEGYVLCSNPLPSALVWLQNWTRSQRSTTQVSRLDFQPMANTTTGSFLRLSKLAIMQMRRLIPLISPQIRLHAIRHLPLITAWGSCVLVSLRMQGSAGLSTRMAAFLWTTSNLTPAQRILCLSG